MKNASWKPDALAKSHLKQFQVRVEVLSEYAKRQAYAEVVREGQEALEIGIKGMLRSLGVQPTFTHDPGKELPGLEARMPSALRKIVPDLIRWSRDLRRQRELAYYGAPDFIPTEEFTAEDANEVLEFLNRVSQVISDIDC